MAPSRWVKLPPLPVTIPAEAVTDHACEKCGHTMRIRRSKESLWFYGCSRWPDCHFTFDADQTSGAPIFHTRHGVPFRAELKETPALFAALKANPFKPEAGQRLESARKASQTKRVRSQKAIERAEVKSRAKTAAPNTPAEWFEFVLTERQRAKQEVHDLENEVKARMETSDTKKEVQWLQSLWRTAPSGRE